MSQINDQLGIGDNNKEEDIVEDYYLASYKQVYEDCVATGHFVTGGEKLWECLKHNYN